MANTPANSTYTDIITTTIESRSRNAQDSLTNNNALLMRLKEKGNIKPITGGSTILQEIFYNDPNTNFASSFSGYDIINISPDSPISSAKFDLKHYAAAVTISGSEMLANSGREQMIDLLATRIEVAESRLLNALDVDLHLDGTGNGSKAIVGLAAVCPASAGNTYGGIDRTSTLGAFWRSYYSTATTSIGGVATNTTIQRAMNNASLSLVRGNDKIDLVYAGLSTYQLFLNSLQTIQRITDDKMGNAGFTSLKYYGGGGGADVLLGGGIGGNANTNYMYFLNSKYLMWRPHRNRNFVPMGGDRMAVNQDAIVKLIGWSGALTCAGGQFHGLLNNV